MEVFMMLRIAGAALFAMTIASVGESQTAIRANVPFTFDACDTSFAAGVYQLWRPSLIRGVWAIRSIQGNTPPCLVHARNGIAAEETSVSKLVFHRYGTRY